MEKSKLLILILIISLTTEAKLLTANDAKKLSGISKAKTKIELNKYLAAIKKAAKKKQRCISLVVTSLPYHEYPEPGLTWPEYYIQKELIGLGFYIKDETIHDSGNWFGDICW